MPRDSLPNGEETRSGAKPATWDAAVPVILAVAAAVRIALLIRWPNILPNEDEGFLRLDHFLAWRSTGFGYPSLVFGPGHWTLMAPVTLLAPHSVIAARIWTALWSTAAIIPFFAYVRRAFGRAEATAAGLLLALSPLHAALSVVTVAEGPCVFFLACALAGWSRMETEGRRGLALFAVGAVGMTSLRFETWILAPLWFGLAIPRLGWRRALPIGAALAAFPLLHMAVCAARTGDPLTFVHTSAAITRATMAHVDPAQRPWMFVHSLMHTAGAPLGALMLAGAVIGALTQAGRLTALSVLALLGAFTAKSVGGTLLAEIDRYTLLPLVLAIPNAAAIPAAVARRVGWTPGRVRAAVGIGAVVLSAAALPSYASWAASRSKYEDSHRFATIVRENLRPDDRLMTGALDALLRVESAVSWDRLVVAPLEAESDPAALRRFWETTEANGAPTLVVIGPGSLLGDAIRPPFQCVSGVLGQTEFDRVAEVGSWCLLRRADTVSKAGGDSSSP